MSSLSSAIQFGQPEMQRIPEFLIAYTRYLHFDETNSNQIKQIQTLRSIFLVFHFRKIEKPL